jgi:hypothetical protein
MIEEQIEAGVHVPFAQVYMRLSSDATRGMRRMDVLGDSALEIKNCYSNT